MCVLSSCVQVPAKAKKGPLEAELQQFKLSAVGPLFVSTGHPPGPTHPVAKGLTLWPTLEHVGSK